MAILAMDLGGSKLATAVFSGRGDVVFRDTTPVDRDNGDATGMLIRTQVEAQLRAHNIDAIGISVPGISRKKTGTVWAPNIRDWEDYPLMREIKEIAGNIPVGIDSDRACGILGEQWQGNAKGCTDAILLAVGTGIGAGILADGNVLRGQADIAGAVGWMGLDKPFRAKYLSCGCFEYFASGAGIPKFTTEVLEEYSGSSSLRNIPAGELSANHVFEAFDKRDPVAARVVGDCITYWGMAAANLVSIFNPEKIIFGGGVFGPAVKYIDRIREEAFRWAQPISMLQVSFEQSALGGDAAVYGAGFLALKNSRL